MTTRIKNAQLVRLCDGETVERWLASCMMWKAEPLTGDGGQEWDDYVERFEKHYIANSVTEEKRGAVFLSWCGRLTYSQTIGTHETIICAAQQESSVVHGTLLTPTIGHRAEILFLLPHADRWGNREGVCTRAALVGKPT